MWCSDTYSYCMHDEYLPLFRVSARLSCYILLSDYMQVGRQFSISHCFIQSIQEPLK